MPETREGHWLPNFRRSVGYLGRHRRALTLGLLSALGVSIFYTFSVSSIVPVLKIIFAEHESLVDWLHRAEAQRRLGVTVPPDVPDDPAGIAVLDVRPGSLNAGLLRPGDRITAVNGRAESSYELMGVIASSRDTVLENATIAGADGSRTVRLELRRHQWWWPVAQSAAARLPTGRTPADRFNTLMAVMLGVVIVTTIGAAFRFANEGLVAVAVQRSMHDLRSGLADHILRLPVKWHASQPPGDTLARFATDIARIETGINTVFGKVIREPLKAIGVLTLTLLLDPHMLLIGAIGLPVGVVVIRVFGRAVKKAQRRASQSWGRLLDHLGERLAGIRVVKAFNMEDAESRRFEAEGRILMRAQTHIEIVDAANSPVLETLAAMAITAFALYGGSRVFNQELEPHIFFGAIICLGAVFDPIRKMGNVYNRMQAAEASGRRVFELMDLPTEQSAALAAPAQPPAAHALNGPPAGTGSAAARLAERFAAPGGHAVEFCDVSFAYENAPERPVIDRASFVIEAGQMVAIVGPNGCGKTTLISLLLRFFEPQSGAIRVGGADIRALPLGELRRRIGLVTQDAVVFSDSVRSNIAYGPRPVTDEEVRAAARLAHIDDFVEGLQREQNGSDGVGYSARVSAWTLSGGQRQRIALARAILTNPPILVLDEATSQVDVESEQKIQQALEDVSRGRTTIVIAHRFSTIARADRIVVMNAGRIVGTGTHEQLIRECPFYASFVRTQLDIGDLQAVQE